jgi:glycine cleavage system protein P-like pyridoxal-binding family
MPGLALGLEFDEMANCLLVCVTETKRQDDLQQFLDVLTQVLEAEKGGDMTC